VGGNIFNRIKFSGTFLILFRFQVEQDVGLSSSPGTQGTNFVRYARGEKKKITGEGRGRAQGESRGRERGLRVEGGRRRGGRGDTERGRWRVEVEQRVEDRGQRAEGRGPPAKKN
jgi:hypothetical protein